MNQFTNSTIQTYTIFQIGSHLLKILLLFDLTSTADTYISICCLTLTETRIPWYAKSKSVNFLSLRIQGTLKVVFFSYPFELCFFKALRKHAYSNILKISPPKKWKFSDKKFQCFHISAQNIDCGYPLEPPRRGGSNEYPQSMLLSKIRKIMYTPVNPSFTI